MVAGYTIIKNDKFNDTLIVQLAIFPNSWNFDKRRPTGGKWDDNSRNQISNVSSGICYVFDCKFGLNIFPSCRFKT